MSGKAFLFKSETGAAFDADYQARLDASTLAGHTLPSAPQQILQNQLMLDLKSAGVYAKADRLGIFVNDGSKEFGYGDWKVPSVLYTDTGTGLVWTSDQHIAKPAGISTSLSIGYTPSTDAVNWGLNDAMVLVRWNGSSGTMGTDGGVIKGANNGLIQSVPATWLYDANFNCLVWINKSGSSNAFGNAYRNIVAFANGSIAIGMNTNTAYLFKNSVQITTVGQTPDGLTQRPILIHDSIASGKDYQYLYAGAFLSASEQADMEAAFQTYLASI